jgi:SPX domain protein involved in polyphosphate accumulation
MEMNMAKAVNKSSEPKYHALRFERKFIYEHAHLEDLVFGTVLSNSFGFQEIYERRMVNNIYFDDQAMSYYTQNVAGDAMREKYRLRWYGDAFEAIKNPTLEVKKKYGDVGDKFSYKMKEFELSLLEVTAQEACRLILEELKRKGDDTVYSTMQRLQPALYNAYERRYFLSHCGRLRITLDYNMHFYNPNITTFKDSKRGLEDIVLELKYERKHDYEARQLAQEIDARLSKNSKYVRGVEINLP